MADAKLVKNIRIVDRDIGDHKVGGQQPPEHILADVAGLKYVNGRAALGPDPLERGSDQQALNLIEVDVVLRAERSNDESSHVCSSSPGR